MSRSPLSAEDLEAMLAPYRLGHYVGSREFEHGADQTNLLVETARGRFVLRYYVKRTQDYAEWEVALLRHLIAHAYPTAAPLADAAGRFVGAHDGKPYALFTFCAGEHDERPDNYRQVARAIARLHRVPLGGTVASDERPAYNPAYCRRAAADSAARMCLQVEARERLDTVEHTLARLRFPDDLPVGVCHGDVNPTNFLYVDGELSAVLDFDQAGATWLIYDVTQLLYWWTWPDDGELDVAASRDLLAHYEAVRGLTRTERDHLYDALILVILIGAAWFLDDDESYANSMRKVRLLEELGREGFRCLLRPQP